MTRVRRDAAVSLGKLGPDGQESIPALVKALSDNDRQVREDSVHALGRICSPRGAAPGSLAQTQVASGLREQAVRGLATSLVDPDLRLRIAAAYELGGIAPGRERCPRPCCSA